MSDAHARRYREAKRLAEEALAMAPEHREPWLLKHCAEDPELSAEIRWLLRAAEDDSEDDLPEQFHVAARSALQAVSLEAPMPRNYRLLERLDAGGSGVVYRAERIDGAMAQAVALKLLAPSAAIDDALALRFANEQAALARLNHPHIAHLIDGGLTADGRPFLATEYVDGEPIDRWCERHAATLQQRIRLMIKICEAVDYAHRHMVIHRDLKPSNILVSTDGQPKLLDFGVARLLDAKSQSEAGTTAADLYMTPAYASPEQASGQTLNAATDVYSLGVVLHELLTGKRPFDDLSDPRARLQALRQQGAPSIRSIGGQSGMKISKDLAAIVDQALQSDPELRYPSASALGRDLERLLDQRPVAARRGGGMYRFGRFIDRHRIGTAMAAVMLIVLIGFVVERERQLDRVAWERDRAEAVTGFMDEIFSGADSLPSRGNAVTVRELLDLGKDRLATEPVFSPAVLGSIHLSLGRAYNALGLGEQALPLLEQARQGLSGRASPLEQARLQADIAAALDAAGRAADAMAADQLAVELLERADGVNENEILALRVRLLRNQANVQNVPLSETLAALDAIEAELAARPEPPAELLFETRAALVAGHVFLDQSERALATAAAARSLVESLYAEDDPRRLRGRHVFATALMLADPTAAIELFEALIEDHRRLIGPSQRLANSLGNLGVALTRAGRDDEAIDAFRQAADMIEQVADRDHYLYRLSVSNRAALYLRQSEPAQAEALIRELLAEPARPATRIEAAYRASALDILGSALALQGRLPEAVAIYREALELLEGEDDRANALLQTSLRQRMAAVEAERSRREDEF